MKQVEVTLRGQSALLMHRFSMAPIEALEKQTPEQQAEYAAYRDPETRELYVPAMAVQRALIGAAVFSKGKGRATLQKGVAACVFVEPERLTLGTDTYQVDARSVVNPSTRGRVIRYRPRLDAWEIRCVLHWDPTLLTEAQLRRVVDDMGQRVGLLDFRPAHNGPFGRCVVVHWEAAGDG